MNVPTKEKVLELFDRQVRDHPIGDIAGRYVDELLKPPAPAEKPAPVPPREKPKPPPKPRPAD
jgi:hypothetical protein